MFVKSIELRNFRNIQNLVLSDLSTGLNIIFGDNAQGKTNFVESLYFTATGRSHRTSKEKDLINLDSSACYINANIEGAFSNSNITVELTNTGRRAKVNGVPIKKLGELYGHLYIIMFSPEDLSLVKSGPINRRRFLDMELCQIYPKYYNSLQFYYKILKQRNELLKSISKTNKNISTLDIWDEQLSLYGKIIIQYRQNFINELSAIANSYQKEISQEKENLQIKYKESVDAELFLERLKKTRESDIFRGQTSIGIHKDDMQFILNDKDAKFFASQGQQRSISLSLKMSSVEFIKREKKENPVLLLDDVLSELDESRQKHLLSGLLGIQIFITTTDKNLKSSTNASFFEIRDGVVTQ